MTLGIYQRAIGVFPKYRDIVYALDELKNAGFPMHKVSVVAREAIPQNDLAGVEVRATAGNESGEGSLMGLGIPEEGARGYNERVIQGDYLAIVEGTEAEIRRAESILSHAGIQQLHIYDVPPPTDDSSTYTSGNLDANSMALGQKKRGVGVFTSRKETEDTLHELKNTGFPMDTVSVVAQDANRHNDIASVDVGADVGNQADLGAAKGAITGGTLGGLTGLLLGIGALAIPGIGPIMLAGATATALATTLSGTAIGAVAGGFLGSLVGLGIPEEQAKVYNERLTRGEYLVIIDAPENQLLSVEPILKQGGIQDWEIYDFSSFAPTSGDHSISTAPGVIRS